MDCYDRQGNPISLEEFGRLHRDKTYVVLACTEIESYLISTVWLGINHNFLDGPPLIFETMVFDENHHDVAINRYATEEEALEGHETMVAEVALLESAV